MRCTKIPVRREVNGEQENKWSGGDGCLRDTPGVPANRKDTLDLANSSKSRSASKGVPIVVLLRLARHQSSEHAIHVVLDPQSAIPSANAAPPLSMLRRQRLRVSTRRGLAKTGWTDPINIRKDPCNIMVYMLALGDSMPSGLSEGPRTYSNANLLLVGRLVAFFQKA